MVSSGQASQAGDVMDLEQYGRKTQDIKSVGMLCPEALRGDAIGLDKYKLGEPLGRGYKSSVYAAKHIRTGTQVALKQYVKDRLDPPEARQVEREVEVHTGLSHRNVLAMYAAFEDEEAIYLVLEHCSQGDLYSLKSRWGGRLDERSAVSLVIHPMLSVLSFLHGEGIVHRDIKPENILMDANLVLKLADFGLCIDLQAERPVTRLGTLDFMSPELLYCPRQGEHDYSKDKSLYNAKVDCWAVGVLAYELLSGKTPFEASSEKSKVDKIRSQEIKCSRTWSEEACDFILRALERDPNFRPTALQLLKHPWLTLHGRVANTQMGAAGGHAARSLAPSPTPAAHARLHQPGNAAKLPHAATIGGLGHHGPQGFPMKSAGTPLLSNAFYTSGGSGAAAAAAAAAAAKAIAKAAPTSTGVTSPSSAKEGTPKGEAPPARSLMRFLLGRDKKRACASEPGDYTPCDSPTQRSSVDEGEGEDFDPMKVDMVLLPSQGLGARPTLYPVGFTGPGGAVTPTQHDSGGAALMSNSAILQAAAAAAAALQDHGKNQFGRSKSTIGKVAAQRTKRRSAEAVVQFMIPGGEPVPAPSHPAANAKAGRAVPANEPESPTGTSMHQQALLNLTRSLRPLGSFSNSQPNPAAKPSHEAAITAAHRAMLPLQKAFSLSRPGRGSPAPASDAFINRQGAAPVGATAALQHVTSDASSLQLYRAHGNVNVAGQGDVSRGSPARGPVPRTSGCGFEEVPAPLLLPPMALAAGRTSPTAILQRPGAHPYLSKTVSYTPIAPASSLGAPEHQHLLPAIPASNCKTFPLTGQAARALSPEPSLSLDDGEVYTPPAGTSPPGAGPYFGRASVEHHGHVRITLLPSPPAPPSGPVVTNSGSPAKPVARKGSLVSASPSGSSGAVGPVLEEKAAAAAQDKMSPLKRLFRSGKSSVVGPPAPLIG